MKRSFICMLALAALSFGGNSFAAQQAKSAQQKETREIYGKIQSFQGTEIILQTRTASILKVDAKPAVEAQRSVLLFVGRSIAVKGTLDKAGVLHAEILQRAKDSSRVWPADR